jgi:hypothetical protein
MSNHATNRLEVKGALKWLDAFVPANASSDAALSFARLLPCPVSPRDPKRWKTEHWGTPDDAIDVVYHRTLFRLYYAFDTEWTPPGAWLAALAKEWPELGITHLWSEESTSPGGEMRFYHEDGSFTGRDVPPGQALDEAYGRFDIPR